MFQLWDDWDLQWIENPLPKYLLLYYLCHPRPPKLSEQKLRCRNIRFCQDIIYKLCHCPTYIICFTNSSWPSVCRLCHCPTYKLCLGSALKFCLIYRYGRLHGSWQTNRFNDAWFHGRLWEHWGVIWGWLYRRMAIGGWQRVQPTKPRILFSYKSLKMYFKNMTKFNVTFK